MTVRFSAADRFAIGQTHVAIASSLEGLPRADSGAPQIGLFPLSSQHNPGVRTVAHVLGLEELALSGDSLFVAAHASIMDESGVEHGSWGAGRRFRNPGPPATYFTVPRTER